MISHILVTGGTNGFLRHSAFDPLQSNTTGQLKLPKPWQVHQLDLRPLTGQVTVTAAILKYSLPLELLLMQYRLHPT